MKQKIPQHIAIVMDGNGRWAQQRGLDRVEGHRAGVASVRTVIKACRQEGVEVLSLFAFSSENWSRPPAEVNFLMQLFMQALHQEITDLQKNGIRLCFCGDRQGLAPALCAEMAKAEQLTAHNSALIVNVAVNYGGKWDLVQAIQQIVTKVQQGQIVAAEINEQLVDTHLGTNFLPDPDLFIRTSGEQRLSNFFLWQLAYTELYFTAKHWPDFDDEEFAKALDSFAQRQRRYGKTSAQITEVL